MLKNSHSFNIVLKMPILGKLFDISAHFDDMCNVKTVQKRLLYDRI